MPSYEELSVIVSAIKQSWTDVYHVLIVSWLDPSIEGFFVRVLARINFAISRAALFCLRVSIIRQHALFANSRVWHARSCQHSKISNNIIK